MKLDPIAKPIRIRLSYTDKREFASLESLKQSFDLDEVRGLLKGDSMIRWLKQNGETSLCKKIETCRKSPDMMEDDEIIDMFFGCDDPHDRKYVASMKELGFIYWEAKYTAQNNDKAIASFRKAKNTGDFEGEALMYIVENESGDERSGVKLISLARDKRFANLSKSIQGRVYGAIGDYYQFEKKDYKSASLNYTTATEKGWDCDMACALLYQQLKDYDKALEYLRKCFISSLEENDEDDIYLISGMLPSWMVATGKCSDEEIVNAYKEAARYGNADACLVLGYFYLQGERGCTQDFKEAISLFNKALEFHDKEEGVRYYLALCYLDGYGVDKDINKAKQLLEEEIGLSNGQYSNWAKDKLKEISGTSTSKENYTDKELKAFYDYLRGQEYKGTISRFCLFSQAVAYHIPQSLALEIAKEYKIKIV